MDNVPAAKASALSVRRGPPAALALLLAAGALCGGTPRVRYLDTRVLEVTADRIVAQGQFEIVGGQQRWFRAYFQLRLDSKTPLKQQDGRDFILFWGEVFPPANADRALYDAVRIGIDLRRLERAANLPKAKTTLLWLTCDVWDKAGRKYMGTGWAVRTPLIVTTDAGGRVVRIEKFNTNPLRPQVSDKAKSIAARRAALKTDHATLRDTVGLYQIVDAKGAARSILTAGGYQAPLRSAHRGYFFDRIDTPGKAREFALLDWPGSIVIRTRKQYEAIVAALRAKGWRGADAADKAPAVGVHVEAVPGVGYRVRATLAVARDGSPRRLGPVVLLKYSVAHDGRFGCEVRRLVRAPSKEGSAPAAARRRLPLGPNAYDRSLRGVLTSAGSEALPDWVKVSDEQVRIARPQRPDRAGAASRPVRLRSGPGD